MNEEIAERLAVAEPGYSSAFACAVETGIPEVDAFNAIAAKTGEEIHSFELDLASAYRFATDDRHARKLPATEENVVFAEQMARDIAIARLLRPEEIAGPTGNELQVQKYRNGIAARVTDGPFLAVRDPIAIPADGPVKQIRSDEKLGLTWEFPIPPDSGVERVTMRITPSGVKNGYGKWRLVGTRLDNVLLRRGELEWRLRVVMPGRAHAVLTPAEVQVVLAPPPAEPPAA